jgi:hypothetical protein
MEKAMKKTLMLLSLMLTGLLVYLHADTKKDSRMGYQTATIVSVDKHVTPSNYVGTSPSDAPLQADDYSYDIGIRLNCNLYVGRYESAIDYLPADFALNHSVDVRLDRHVMYVSLPQGDRDVKMGIVSHHLVKTESCKADS